MPPRWSLPHLYGGVVLKRHRGPRDLASDGALPHVQHGVVLKRPSALVLVQWDRPYPTFIVGLCWNGVSRETVSAILGGGWVERRVAYAQCASVQDTPSTFAWEVRSKGLKKGRHCEVHLT